jgi:competence protein ComGC
MDNSPKEFLVTFLVCGVRGAGKTAFCNELVRLTGMSSINLGDCLVARLAEDGVVIPERKHAGKQFLQIYGVSAYIELVSSVAAKYDIIDGLRLSASLQSLRERGSIVVAWKQAPSESDRLNESDFSEDLLAIKRLADYIIPWAVDAQELPLMWRSSIQALLQLSR